MRFSTPNREAVATVESLGPPAVQNRTIQTAVEHHLLAAGARGLQWSAGIVEPDVHTLNEMPAYVDVVIFHKHNATGQPGIVPQIGNLADQPLAWLVCRMGLASKNNLNRPIGIADHRKQAVDIAQHEVGPLVGCKAAGKSDREDVWVEHRARCLNSLIALAAPSALPAHSPANKLQEKVFECVVGFPQFAWIDLVNLLPDVGLTHPLHPVGRKNTVVKLQHLPRKPARHVHAVGDVADRHFLFNPPRPEVGPHLAADVSVQSAHGIGSSGKLEPEHSHTERLVMVVGLHAAQPH